MGEWTFRVLGQQIVLDADEQDEVATEIARLQTIIRGASGAKTVRVNQNPAGLVGDYASLLIEATVRGCVSEEVLPAEVQRRYGKRHWFTVSREVLTAFCQEWAAVLAEDAAAAATPKR